MITSVTDIGLSRSRVDILVSLGMGRTFAVFQGMLLASPSGSGKTNLLYDIIISPLVYYDQIHLYAKNLEQDKYQQMIKAFDAIGKNIGYDPLVYSNNNITSVENLMDDGSQKIVLFDDYVTEKNQKPLIDYFIRGRHKNCSVIYLTQSYYGCPKDIRLNFSHFCIYDFPSSNERSLISRELSVNKDQYTKATEKQYSFLYVDKPRKIIKRNFCGIT